MRRRWWFGALAVTVLLAAACSKNESAVETSPSTSSAPTTTAAPGTDGSTTSSTGKPKGAELGGFVKPEASTAFLTKVAQKTRAANTGRFSLSIVVDGATGTSGHVDVMSLSGAYDKDNNRSQITLDMSGLVAADPDAAAAAGLDPTLYGSPIEIVQDGDTQYIKIESFATLLGKPWMKSSGGDQSGFNEILDMFKVEDISGFLETLQASGDVADQGKETVDGAEVVHYHADVDPREIDTTKNASAGKLLSSFEGATTAAIDVFVDGNALVRKLSIAADAAALGKDVGPSFPDGTATLTMGLSGFSEAIDFDIPSPDEVVDASGLGLDPSTDSSVPE